MADHKQTISDFIDAAGSAQDALSEAALDVERERDELKEALEGAKVWIRAALSLVGDCYGQAGCAWCGESDGCEDGCLGEAGRKLAGEEG